MIVIFESILHSGLPKYAHRYFSLCRCPYTWVDLDPNRRRKLHANGVKVSDGTNIDGQLAIARVVALHYSERGYYADRFGNDALEYLASKVNRSCVLLVFTRDPFMALAPTIDEVAKTPLAARISFFCIPGIDNHRTPLVRLLRDAHEGGSCIDAAAETFFLLDRMDQVWRRSLDEFPPLAQRFLRYCVRKYLQPTGIDWDLLMVWSPKELAAKLRAIVFQEVT